MPLCQEIHEAVFENDELSPDELPDADTLSWQDVDSRFVKRQRMAVAIAMAIVVAGVGALHAILAFAFASAGIVFSLWWLWPIVAAIGVPLFVWPAVSYRHKGYAIRDRDIVYRSGVVWRTVTAVPYNRIQHVEKSSTPLDRRYELATLQLFTAGGSRGDLKIDGLPASAAEKMRAFILDRIGSGVEQT